MGFRVILSAQAQHQIGQVSYPTLDTLQDCLDEIQADPFREQALRVRLVTPHDRTYPDVYLCAIWAIAYSVRGEDVVVEAIGPFDFRPL